MHKRRAATQARGAADAGAVSEYAHRKLKAFIFLSTIFMSMNPHCSMPGRLIPLLAALGIGCGHIAAAVFSKLDAKTQPDVFVWTDTCNVTVRRTRHALGSRIRQDG